MVPADGHALISEDGLLIDHLSSQFVWTYATLSMISEMSQVALRWTDQHEILTATESATGALHT